MATYIAGVTDYIPQLQPFKPDFNFLGNMLQTKQSRYDAGYKQLSSLYGTLLNSPMLRDENIAKRDEFFKSIDGNIQKISGLDLSLEQNVDLAKSVFKGFYEDKDIIKDMTWTKNYYNQKERSQAMRNCIDPDKCGGKWWEGGDRYLDYKAQEFKNASKEEALNFGNVNYIAAQDFQGKAIKAAKDAGFNVKYDEVKGDWIVTTTNGTAMVKPLSEFYLSTYGSDPAMMDFFKAQAYTNRKDWVSSNLNNYGSEDEANMAYVQNYYEQINKTIKDGKTQAQEDSDVLKQKSKDIDEHIKKNGVLDSDSDWLESWSETKSEAETADNNVKAYEDADNSLALVGENMQNLKAYLSYFDNSAALDILKRNALNAASQYASLTSESTFRENPVAAAEKQRAFEWKKLQYTEGTYDPKTGEYIPGTDIRGQMMVKQYEESVKKKAIENLENLRGQYFQYEGVGAATPAAIVAGKTQAQNQNMDLFNGTKASIIKTNKDFLIGLVNNYREHSKKNPNDKRSIVVVLDDIFRKANIGIKGVDLLSDDEAFASAVEKINNLSPELLNSMYQKSLDYTDSQTANGQVYSKFLPNKAELELLKAQQKDNLETYSAIIKQIETPRAEALTEFKSKFAPELTELQKSDDEEDQFKALLLQEAMSDQKNLSDRGIEQLARAFAEKNQSRFSPRVNTVTGAPMYESASAASYSRSDSKDVSYDFAKQYLREVKKNYDALVLNNTVAWNSADPNVKGTSTNGLAARVNEGTISGDAIMAGTSMAKDFGEISVAFKKAVGNRDIDAVKFGDQFIYGEDKKVDPSALSLINMVLQDLTSTDEDIRKKATAAFGFSPISGGDAEKVLFYVKPNSEYVKEKLGSEDKKVALFKKLEDAQADPTDGIAAEIPVKYLEGTNVYRRLNKSTEDFRIAKNGMANYEIPRGGYAKVVKSGNNYMVETVFKKLDEKGNLVDDPFQMQYVDPKTFNVADFKNKFYRDAIAIANANNLKRNDITKAMGIKDPTILNK